MVEVRSKTSAGSDEQQRVLAAAPASDSAQHSASASVSARKIYRSGALGPKQTLFPHRKKSVKTYGSKPPSRRAPAVQRTLTQMYLEPTEAQYVNLVSGEEDAEATNTNVSGRPDRRRTMGDVESQVDRPRDRKRRKTAGDIPSSSTNFHTQTSTQFMSAKGSKGGKAEELDWNVGDSDDETVKDSVKETAQSLKRRRGAAKVSPHAPVQRPSTPPRPIATPRTRALRVEVPSSQSPATPDLLAPNSIRYDIADKHSSPLKEGLASRRASLRTASTVVKTAQRLEIQDSYSTTHSMSITPSSTKGAEVKTPDRHGHAWLSVNEDDVSPGRKTPEGAPELRSSPKTGFRASRRGSQAYETPTRNLATRRPMGGITQQIQFPSVADQFPEEDKENFTPGRTQPKSPKLGLPTADPSRQPLREIADSEAETEIDTDVDTEPDLDGTTGAMVIAEYGSEHEIDLSEKENIDPASRILRPAGNQYVVGVAGTVSNEGIRGEDEAHTGRTEMAQHASDTAEEEEETIIPDAVVQGDVSYGVGANPQAAPTPSGYQSQELGAAAVAATPSKVVTVPGTPDEELDSPETAVTPPESWLEIVAQTPNTSPAKEPAVEAAVATETQLYTQGLESQRVPLEVIRATGSVTDRSDIVITLYGGKVDRILDRTMTHMVERWKIPVTVVRVWVYMPKPQGMLKYMCIFGPRQPAGKNYKYPVQQIYELNNPVSHETLQEKGWYKGSPRYEYIPPALVGQLTANLRCCVFDGEPTQKDVVSSSPPVTRTVQQVENPSSDPDIIPSTQFATKTAAGQNGSSPLHGALAQPTSPTSQPASSRKLVGAPISQRTRAGRVRSSQATTISNHSSSSPLRSEGKSMTPRHQWQLSSPTPHRNSPRSSQFPSTSQMLPDSLLKDRVVQEPPAIVWDSNDELSD